MASWASRATASQRARAWLPTLALLPALLVPACASSEAGRGSAPQRPPLTDLDPAPYRPVPTTAAGAGDTRALAVTSHVDSAVQLALDFIAAVREADMPRARALMADEMFRLGERDFYRPMTANVALAQLQQAVARARSSGARPAPLARLLQLQQAEVSPPRPSTPQGQRGLQPSDSLVTFPITAEGRVELARWYPGWSTRVRILVRTNGTPRVIGF
ncbi:MAG: hypothetical protein KC593_17820 [Myxococcales bacterium]|nr:hypothetical protein [Myxococcales bacterium]